MENSTEVTPQMEYAFLKAGGHSALGLGLGLTGYLVGGTVGIVCLSIMVLLLIRYAWVTPGWDYVFGEIEFKDEYYNHLYARACKKTLVVILFALGATVGFFEDRELELSSYTVVIIISIFACVVNGVSILWLLRESE
ncbi:hypothetical protein MHM98_15885 [Psychrobium sp. MM17-31]|uniref:hypothetical protein n=1 Tax=Psychrobium sp. MM17-31 TaxID=2917758 RepID=UPI001EF44511|nr:hypothetical protein [Psychrobium sp. MM17-31]MCG7532812.1 hypothetical protein [Psychrobium sp. MM17-31]